MWKDSRLPRYLRDIPADTCGMYVNACVLQTIISSISDPGLCTMRVYALYSQDRRVLVGLIIAGVALLIVATVSTHSPDNCGPDPNP